MTKTLSADQHADAMSDYIADGTKRALALNNRGPIAMDDRLRDPKPSVPLVREPQVQICSLSYSS